MLGRNGKRSFHAVMVYCDVNLGEVPWVPAGIIETLGDRIQALNGEYVPNGQSLSAYYARLTDQYGYSRVVISQLPNPVR